MITKVISAFPGTGKSYFAASFESSAEVFDLDTGNFTQGYGADGKVIDPDFPNNYLLAIKEQIGKTKTLLVGCQPEVIAALRKEEIPFTIVYPERGLKGEYIDRFKLRHSPQSFIELISNNWDLFLDFLEKQEDCERIILRSEQYVGDAVSVQPSGDII